MSKRRLPIGIQTFRKMREDNCYYVDKTAYIRRGHTLSWPLLIKFINYFAHIIQ